ncbi:MAG: xanthine dehydrogenase accessory factor [Natronomonas sp.]|jgi:xanthine dehydrogenase accessory factor|uniref:XdhC family protein n=1 Tax=Natronomonas sp. TaxID=2184060 RepID=UPI003989530F
MINSQPWGVSDRELYERLRALRTADVDAAVASVVDVAGSAYRRPGAKLVAPTDGNALGAITAGCLDGPVAKLAVEARRSGEMALETFDLTGNDWGLGVGCNGVIDVFVEPLDDSIDPMLRSLENGDPAAALTVVKSDDSAVPVGARTVCTDAGVETDNTRSALPDDALMKLRDTAEAARGDGTSTLASVTREAGDLRVFVDGVEPAPELLLFGAEEDTDAVASFGAEVGFRVTVASPRGGRADPEDFSGADQVHAIHPTDVDSLVETGGRTYAVLLSHNLVDDRLALTTLLEGTEIPYIGVMGPRKRFEELRETAVKDGWSFTRAELDRISAPVGLDLGDGTPTGIAMSIVSEVLAAANDADGGRLSERSGPIHARQEPSRSERSQ